MIRKRLSEFSVNRKGGKLGLYWKLMSLKIKNRGKKFIKVNIGF